MRYYRPFRNVIPRSKAGHPRVTHPFATLLIPCGTFAFDLHVLGTPPALILSQDQTLMLNSLSIDAAAMRRLAEEQLFNARPIGSALFNPFVCRGDGRTGEITSWACLPEARTDDLVGRLLPSHALTLIVKRGWRPLDRV